MSKKSDFRFWVTFSQLFFLLPDNIIIITNMWLLPTISLLYLLILFLGKKVAIQDNILRWFNLIQYHFPNFLWWCSYYLFTLIMCFVGNAHQSTHKSNSNYYYWNCYLIYIEIFTFTNFHLSSPIFFLNRLLSSKSCIRMVLLCNWRMWIEIKFRKSLRTNSFLLSIA